MSAGRIRICFVAPNALPVIDATVPGSIGGIETRSWLFARTLARRAEVNLSFVVRDAVNPAQTEPLGVHLLTLCEPLTAVRRSIAANVVRSPRFPGFSIRRWSWGLCWKLPILALAKLSRQPHGLSGGLDPFLNRIESDVFCTFGVNPASASAVTTAHARGLPAILILGSDGDLDPRFLEGARYANQYGDRGDMSLQLLQQADAIVAQTPWQQSLLQERFGRHSTLIENPIDVAEWTQQLRTPAPCVLPETPYVLWIGRAEYTPKQPLKVLDIARQLPAVQFLMVLNPFDAEVEDEVRRTRPHNVSIVERVPPVAMASLFARAVALLNTSTFEGFPNTFLQAALSAVPIVSLHVSPRSSLDLEYCTCAQGDPQAVVSTLRSIVSGATDTSRLTQLRDAVSSAHDAERQAGLLLELCRKVVASR